ncbi:hypothetical protein B0H63DRAFT_517112 [Podospora didyma]|uniref:Heterokaryon incompatibility domain-containing protein n=1 Tax=Podospora didyma TaxID=330526 RepID=A0AAE0P600_9PEZI|nr:hypothetical protein B0H63DRAFT_517112 [Podospora didyma]
MSTTRTGDSGAPNGHETANAKTVRLGFGCGNGSSLALLEVLKPLCDTCWRTLAHESVQPVFTEHLRPDFIPPQSADQLPPELRHKHSIQCLEFVQKMLLNCLSNSAHDCEPKPSPGVDWPRRILEIDEQVIKLVNFDSASMAGNLRRGILISSLPLTLRQAVYLCSYLGIAYIWIDALCILQGQTLDWEQEAQKMETVYCRSRITIIAASSTSCHSGFLDVDLESLARDLGLDTPFIQPPARLVARHEA